MLPTPHISAEDKNMVADTVIMPGDPLRAKLVAEKYLENIVQFNALRGMLGFTGEYKGKRVSIMGSGMGIPSVGIYSYELYKFYDVKNIIRIGSCGAYHKDFNIYDIVLADSSFSESTFAKIQSKQMNKVLMPSDTLNKRILDTAAKLNTLVKSSRVHTSDVFYVDDEEYFASLRQEMLETNQCNVVEMESFGLFATANVLNKHAACILTVSDSFVTKESTSGQERQTVFMKMAELALESV